MWFYFFLTEQSPFATVQRAPGESASVPPLHSPLSPWVPPRSSSIVPATVQWAFFFLTFPFFQSSVDSKKVNKHQAAKESTRWDVRGWGSTQGWSREWEKRAGQSPLLERVLRSSVRLLSRLSRLQRGKETAAASGCRACLSDRVKLCSQPPSASLPPSYVATPLPPLTILP